jgi:hypothetical protein
MDQNFKRIFKKRVANDLAVILQTLSPFADQLQGLGSNRPTIGTGWSTV